MYDTFMVSVQCFKTTSQTWGRYIVYLYFLYLDIFFEVSVSRYFFVKNEKYLYVYTFVKN